MQSLLWIIGNVLPYVAVAVLVLGIAGRALRWQTMPSHLPWRFYPMPKNLAEQAQFMAAEIFTFRAVLHENKVLWVGAWFFHVSMALVVLWGLLLLVGLPIAVLGVLGFLLMGITAVYLIAYRLLVPTSRALTTPVEIINLSFFLLVALLTTAIYLFQPIPLEALRAYLLGLCTFGSPELPQSSLFPLLLLLVEVLMVYFPFSRMLHMVNKYFAFHTVNWGHS